MLKVYMCCCGILTACCSRLRSLRLALVVGAEVRGSSTKLPSLLSIRACQSLAVPSVSLIVASFLSVGAERCRYFTLMVTLTVCIYTFMGQALAYLTASPQTAIILASGAGPAQRRHSTLACCPMGSNAIAMHP